MKAPGSLLADAFGTSRLWLPAKSKKCDNAQQLLAAFQDAP
jgi:hypothetical protein